MDNRQKGRDRNPVEATSPDDSRWSFPALLAAFGASLSMWMRRYGVRVADVPDATQEALVEAWRGAATIPATPELARVEMLRMAAKVAQRWRRYAGRLVCVEELDAPDSRDLEAWIATRMIWLEALYRLDEPSRKLLIAYKVDGHTYAQIGAEMHEKEDTIRKRVHTADKKLQEELEKLLGKDKNRKGSSGAMVGLVAFDPFDRAVFRAILDVEEAFGFDAGPASSVRPKVQTNAWPWQFVPVGGLAVALFLVPGQGWHAEPLTASKFGGFSMSPISAPTHASRVLPGEPTPASKALPRKTERHEQPIPSDADAAIMKKLRARGAELRR